MLFLKWMFTERERDVLGGIEQVDGWHCQLSQSTAGPQADKSHSPDCRIEGVVHVEGGLQS